MENTILGNSTHTVHQNELAFCIPDYMLQDLNVPGSANEAQENPHRQQSRSLGKCISAFSSDQESEQNQMLEDQVRQCKCLTTLRFISVESMLISRESLLCLFQRPEMKSMASFSVAKGIFYKQTEDVELWSVEVMYRYNVCQSVDL